MNSTTNALPSDPAALAQLEQALHNYLAAPPFWLSFAPAIEEGFDLNACEIRLRRFRITLISALALFALLAVCDWFFASAAQPQPLFIRALVFASVAWLGLITLPKLRSAQHREFLLTTLIATLAASQVIIVWLLPLSVAKLYEGVMVLALLQCNQVGRVRFRYALPFTFLWLLLYFLQEISFADTHTSSLALSMSFATLLAAISLSGKRTMELDNREAHALKLLHAIASRKLKYANQALTAQARFDTLTSLPNRREFDEYSDRIIGNAQRTCAQLSLIFIDVDYFKRYNDHYGHAAGDDCLCFVASLIRFAARRPLDMVARYGGEEFVVLLPDTDCASAAAVAEEIRQLIDATNNPHADSPFGHITVSIGVVGGVCDASLKPKDLLASADQVLYAAKAAGRNCVKQGTIQTALN